MQIPIGVTNKEIWFSLKDITTGIWVCCLLPKRKNEIPKTTAKIGHFLELEITKSYQNCNFLPIRLGQSVKDTKTAILSQ
jgi:hypothetical protein